VLRVGQLTNKFFIIKSGSVRVTRGGSTDTMIAGGYFGENALMREIASDADVTTAGAVQFFVLDRLDFEREMGPLAVSDCRVDVCVLSNSCHVSRTSHVWLYVCQMRPCACAWCRHSRSVSQRRLGVRRLRLLLPFRRGQAPQPRQRSAFQISSLQTFASCAPSARERSGACRSCDTFQLVGRSR
jgi:hypothetical protein